MRAMALAAPAALQTSPLSSTDLPIPVPEPGEARGARAGLWRMPHHIHVVQGDLPVQRARC
jgi:hypothetical protein